MDLSVLLDPARIKCQCDIQSKKRALQTLAELLGAALRKSDEIETDDRVEMNGSAETVTETPAENTERKPARDFIGDRLHGRRAARRSDKQKSTDDDERRDELSDMDILDALIMRERLGSTGLGHGVALPHSRMANLDSPIAAMITLNEGVDFESADDQAVDIILALLVPEECNDEHLKILAALAQRFNHAALRKTLRSCESGDELFAQLTGS
jgi:PTS system nitrogen regulatory IIA component